MSVKLTDREVSALAKKLEEKHRKAAEKKLNAVASKKIPEAKKIIAVLSSLPEVVLDDLYNNRYTRTNVSAQRLARVLAKAERDEESVAKKDLESEVILAAHDCSSLTALCKKLDI